jgi:hypothetical protein
MMSQLLPVVTALTGVVKLPVKRVIFAVVGLIQLFANALFVILVGVSMVLVGIVIHK